MRTQKMIDRAARDEERLKMPDKDEWCRRYGVHLIKNHAGIEKHEAEMAAESGWQKEQRKNPDWYQQSPEAAADEELMFWEE